MFLLVGGDSEIGAAAYLHLKAAGTAAAATTRRPERTAGDRPLLDLAADLSSFEPAPDTSAACILAATARLAACAADPAGSAHINVLQTLNLAKRLTARGIYVLFVSSNQVFDGSVAHVHADAPTSPVSEYGRQKAAAEAVLRERMRGGAPIGILRLAKVVSTTMPLLHGWVRALSAGGPIRAFHDMTMAPVPTEFVSAAIAALLESRAPGVYQLSGPQDVSYADVAYRLARQLGAGPGAGCCSRSHRSRNARRLGAAPHDPRFTRHAGPVRHRRARAMAGAGCCRAESVKGRGLRASPA
jgi:dTDP-4-dehydrorhamnose reductase